MATKRTARTHRQTKKKVVETTISPEPTQVDVSVIVLNYNTPKLTVSCVKSVIAHTKNIAYEIIVVDNASTNDSVSYFKKQLPKTVKLVAAERNLGFGPGNNLGAQEARGDYLFFINSDTLLESNCISSLAEFADSHPEFPLIGPTVLLPKTKTVQPASFGQLPTLWRLVSRQQHTLTKINPQLEYVETGWVTGAALFISTDVYIAAGGFDSRYFMYYEDQDLCANVRKLGGRIAVVPAAQIIHLGGKSIGKKKIRYRYYDESQVKYFIKHHGLISTILLIVIRWPWRWFR